MLAIVDYGMGNLRSVWKGFAKVGVEARVVNTAKDINAAGAVVLPGVGAFRDCIGNLEALGLAEPIKNSIRGGKPFLGICLGLHALFTESYEFGRYKGLDIFKGKVVRFPEIPGLKVPQIGWNTINIKRRAPVLDGIPDASSFYFVHSYYVIPEDPSIVAATTDYGLEYASMIWKDNVFAAQFHPEKSQAMGLKILKAFGDFVKSS
ncbi:MAG: imidazole glycerol phosphate synthase subunit HisH [Nitrospiraceae bacterium]|nr:imidazole glycerol phosphate synthase subunit HisH [Nitrospiraceae bacterium]